MTEQHVKADMFYAQMQMASRIDRVLHNVHTDVDEVIVKGNWDSPDEEIRLIFKGANRVGDVRFTRNNSYVDFRVRPSDGTGYTLLNLSVCDSVKEASIIFKRVLSEQEQGD